MSVYSLPTTLTVAEKEYKIRSDYRVVLDCVLAMRDPNVEHKDKLLIVLCNIYEDAYRIMKTDDPFIKKADEVVSLFDDIEQAIKQAMWFIAGGKTEAPKKQRRMMDWEQDFPLIVAPINQIAGTEIRALPYWHWWSFLAAYMNIGESTFLNVVEIRRKLAAGKKLEKWERDFYNNNRSLVTIQTKLSESDEKALADIFSG